MPLNGRILSRAPSARTVTLKVLHEETGEFMTLTRAEIATTDVESVREMLTQAYAGGLTVGHSGDTPFVFEQAVASDGTVSVATLRFAGRVTATMDGAREVLFTDISKGRYSWRSRAEAGDQDRSLILPARHELTVEFDAVRSVMVTVDPPTVTRWMSRYGGLPPSPALLHQAAAGSEAVRHTIRYYGEVMATDAFESDLVRASLLDVLLSMTAHHLLSDPPPAQRREAPAALVRAEDYLRAHAGEAVSIADAAEAARLSVRGLQDQFQKWLHVTPAEYLRNVRLERARADLVQARTDGVPVRVGDVARRWGFTHLGRFAGSYAEAFGESPSVTLAG
jgi:AraC-like DNA-binding protein